MPFSQKTDQEVSFEFPVKDLGKEVKIGNECSLQDNGDVWSIEKLNGVRLFVSFHFSACNCQFNSESLYIETLVYMIKNNWYLLYGSVI